MYVPDGFVFWCVVWPTLILTTLHHPSQYTVKMLATLEKFNGNFHILLIDDHREDGSVETLRALGYAAIPKLKASGLTDSWNLGYSHFLKYNYGTLFPANNDVLVPDGAIGAIQTLLEFYPFMASLIKSWRTRSMNHQITNGHRICSKYSASQARLLRHRRSCGLAFFLWGQGA